MTREDHIGFAISKSMVGLRSLPCYLWIMKRKDLLTLVGFILFILGFTSLALSLVGIRWSFLSWLDHQAVWGLVGKLSMVVIGLILVALAQTDFQAERNAAREEK